MALVLARRLLWMIPILLGISVIVFSMMHLAPGDPAEAILGPRGTEELLRQARRELGLDQPLHVQYGQWVLNAVRGDLGKSYRLNRPVAPEVLDRFKNSALLAGIAFVIAVVIGMLAGCVSAVRRGGLLDNAVMAFTVTGISMPPFYLGMLLIILFSVKLDLLPTGGMYDVRQDPYTSRLLVHLILPTLTLAAVPIAVIARIMRSSMLEVIWPGLHPHRAGERSARPGSRWPPRPAQRPDSCRCRRRSPGWLPAQRRRAGRGRLLLAWTRFVACAVGRPARFTPGPGRRPRYCRRLRRRQHPDRPRPGLARPKDPLRMKHAPASPTRSPSRRARPLRKSAWKPGRRGSDADRTNVPTGQHRSLFHPSPRDKDS